MRITFVLPFAGHAGGIRVVAIYAERLRARGHNVTIISQPPHMPTVKDKINSVLLGTGWPRPATPGPYFDGLDVERRVLDSIRPVRDADVPDADVVIATWWETAYWVAALSPSKGRKFYFVQHHEIHDHLPKEIARGSYYLPLKKITISQWLVDTMRETYGDNDVSLVPNSVDTQHFQAPLRAKHNPPMVGFMYSPIPFKGTEIALAAIEKARSSVPELRVVSFGASRPTSSQPLPDGIVYEQSPKQVRIPDIYAGTDVWIVASRSEGFGLPILEAMACRCPVVATRAGAAPELIRDGENGYVVDVGDVAALADKLVSVLSLSDGDWRRMSDAALATARTYSWEDATDRFETALIG